MANSDSSSDDDDAFSVFNRKKSRRSKKIKDPPEKPKSSNNEDVVKAREIKRSSSAIAAKRHHHQSKARGAKMNALLQELEDTSTNTAVTSTTVPVFQEKMGSFVTPDEEPFTTNIFVGNLAPVTTEEELKEIFRQFGALFTSVSQCSLPWFAKMRFSRTVDSSLYFHELIEISPFLDLDIGKQRGLVFC